MSANAAVGKDAAGWLEDADAVPIRAAVVVADGALGVVLMLDSVLGAAVVVADGVLGVVLMLDFVPVDKAVAPDFTSESSLHPDATATPTRTAPITMQFLMVHLVITVTSINDSHPPSGHSALPRDICIC
jgi:hypothetical protein